MEFHQLSYSITLHVEYAYILLSVQLYHLKATFKAKTVVTKLISIYFSKLCEQLHACKIIL